MKLSKSIINFIREKGEAVKSAEIALAFDVTKSEVNSSLYLMEGSILKKSDSTPPMWSLLPLEEQVINTLRGWGEDGITARDLSHELCVLKSEVNPILYRFEGSLTRHDDEATPNWFIMD